MQMKSSEKRTEAMGYMSAGISSFFQNIETFDLCAGIPLC